MFQALILDSAIGSRAASGSAGGAFVYLLRALCQQQVPSQQCRTKASLTAHELSGVSEAMEPANPCCSISGCSDCGPRTNGLPSGLDAGPLQSVLWHRLPLLLQQQQLPWLQPGLQHRRITTTPNTLYKFDSHLTRYNKSKVANRDNFQRFRDSGRDARVAADILREGEHQGQRGGARRGAGRSEADEALLELRSLVHDCRDLRAMQVLVRECAHDLNSFLVCQVLGRLPQLKQDTPAAAAPEVLARRVADALMVRLEALMSLTSPSSLSHAMVGLANCGLIPSQSLLEVAIERLAAVGPAGGPYVTEADAKTVSKMLSATARFMDLAKHHGPSGPQGPRAAAAAAREGGGGGDGDEELREMKGTQGGSGGVGELLRLRLWPLLLEAAEVKLLRALGEEPPGGGGGGGAGAQRRWRRGGAEEVEVDDSMPQTALRFMCTALALARETHPGIWTAAARLAARHAAELQPAVAASVLRSYVIAGGASLDGGEAKLMEAVWGALGPQAEGLEVEAQLNLLVALLKFAAAKDVGGSGGAAEASQASIAAQAVPLLCGLLASRVPALSSSEATHLMMALAELHTKTVAAAASGGGGGTAPATAVSPAAWRTHPYGVLPRLLADLLVLRGIAGFGASKFAAAALGLGLLGHIDPAFWRQLAVMAAPEVLTMNGATLSRLVGAFHTAAVAAEAQPAAAGGAAVQAPGPALVAAAYSRARSLLDSGNVEEPVTGKPLFHLVRGLAEWPMPEEDGGAATLGKLADRLVEDSAGAREVAAAAPAVRQRFAAALRRAGLGEHALVTRLSGAGQ